MNLLYEISERLIERVPETTIRDAMSWLQEGGRFVGIKGGRGVGKTTLVLQFAKKYLPHKKKLYVSLDDIEFSNRTLVSLADEFVKNGGEYLLLDEVHSYTDWAQEIKNIHDRYPDLQVIFTGSSMLQLSEGTNALSRRAVFYELPGLSLREYIQFSTGIEFNAVSLTEVLENHEVLAKEIWKKIRPLQYFNEYLKGGYYPFYFEHKPTYDLRLRETISKVIESDLLITTGISSGNMEKVKLLLHIISQSVPFQPNIDKLAARMGVGKNTLKDYFRYLEMAGITRSLFTQKKGITRLTKPEKVYLRHPNLMYSLNPADVNPGSVRESFLLSQLPEKHEVHYPDKGDFLIDRAFLIEVGGKNKTSAQLADAPNGWIAADGIETGSGNRIPLWLFGFLY